MEWSYYAQAVVALIFVLGLMGLVVVALRRFGFGTPTPTLGHKNKRVRVVEVTGVDARRRLVLVRHDDREHLILLGLNGEMLIDSRAASAPLPASDTPNVSFASALGKVIGSKGERT